MKRIILISGLGADKRAFSNLHLTSSYEKVHVEWIPPQPKESLTSYVRRLIEKYKITANDVIIGLSFGSLVATEISKIVYPPLTILISGVSTVSETTWYYRLAGRLRLHKTIPVNRFNRPSALLHRLFGLENKKEKELLDAIVSQADPRFVQWAVDKFLTWNNRERPKNTFKIHGTRDRLVPVHRKSTDFIIKGGTHFMTWEKAPEVSAIINRLLEEHTGK